MGKHLSKQDSSVSEENGNPFQLLPNEIFSFLCDFLKDKDILNLAKCCKTNNHIVSQYLESKVTNFKVKALKRLKGNVHTYGEKELFRRCGNSNSNTLLFLRTTFLIEGSQIIRRYICTLEPFYLQSNCRNPRGGNHYDQQLRRRNLLLNTTNKIWVEKIFDFDGMTFPGFFKFSLYMKLHENFNWPHTAELKSTFSISLRDPISQTYSFSRIAIGTDISTSWWRTLVKEKDDFIMGDVKVMRDLGGWVHVIPFYDKPIFLQTPCSVRLALIDKNFLFKKGGIIFDHWQVQQIAENDHIVNNHYKLQTCVTD